MKRVFMLLAVVLLLTTFARAAPLPDGLDALLPEAVARAAEDGGDVLTEGVAWLDDAVRGSLTEIVRSGVRSALTLMLAALLCGAVEGVVQSTGGAAARYVPCCGVLAAAAIATGDLRAMIGLGAQTVEELGTLTRLLLPAMSAAMAAGGYVSTASVWQVTTLMVCSALEEAVLRWMLPLTYCYIAAAAAGAAFGESRLDVLADGLRRVACGALKLITAAFAAYLAVSGVLTGSADRTAARAAKAVISGAVPVVGGMLSDVAESALSAAGALRGTLGAAGVFAILALCLTPLLRLGVQFLLYKLAAFGAGMGGTQELGDFLDRLGEAFALVFAMTATCASVLLAALLTATVMILG